MDKIDPVIGRDEEIRRVIQVLSRRTKNNPVLIGEPGVGKTAIAEGLAQRNVHTSAQLAAHLLEKYAIATLPGSAFHDDALTLRLSSSYLDTELAAGGAQVFAEFARDADDCISRGHPRLQRAASTLAEFISGLGS